MNKFYTLAILFFICLSTYAQAPNAISYQAVVRDGSNELVASTTVGLQISILQGTTSGASVYTETHSIATNVNGLFSVEIAQGNLINGDFNAIDWSNGPYYILTEIDPQGGSNYSITGTSQLLSVPYAIYANTAENVINDAVEDDDADPTNELQNLSEVLELGNDANASSLLNVGGLSVGSAGLSPSAAIEINSTTGAMLLSRMTSQERDALTAVEGMMIFNTEDRKFQGYLGEASSSWSILHNNDNDISSSISVGTDSSGTPNLAGQSFVPPSDGVMQSLVVNVNRASSDLAKCQVYVGEGYGGTLLGEVDVVLNTAGDFTIDLSSQNINLTAGQSYTLKLSSTAPFSTCPILFFMTSDPFGGQNATYPDGTFYDFQGNPDSNIDLWFEIYGGQTLPGGWVDLN